MERTAPRNGAQIPGGWVFAEKGVPLVRFRGSLVLPSRFWAEFEPGEVPYRVELHVKVVGERPTISRLTVAPSASDEISGAGLRSIPVARLLARAVQGAPATVSRRRIREAGEATIVQPRRPTNAEVESLATGRAGRRTPWKLDDDFLTEVADIYRTADALGLPPVLAVAKEKEAVRNTARRWIVEARERGLLEPATEKGNLR